MDAGSMRGPKWATLAPLHAPCMRHECSQSESIGIASSNDDTIHMFVPPRISFKVEFIKSVGFLKGAIEGGAIGNTKKLLQVWVSLRQW